MSQNVSSAWATRSHTDWWATNMTTAKKDTTRDTTRGATTVITDDGVVGMAPYEATATTTW